MNKNEIEKIILRLKKSYNKHDEFANFLDDEIAHTQNINEIDNLNCLRLSISSQKERLLSKYYIHLGKLKELELTEGVPYEIIQ